MHLAPQLPDSAPASAEVGVGWRGWGEGTSSPGSANQRIIAVFDFWDWPQAGHVTRAEPINFRGDIIGSTLHLQPRSPAAPTLRRPAAPASLRTLKTCGSHLHSETLRARKIPGRLA